MKLIFRREALLYDIGNYAYIAGHRLETESGTTPVAHLLIDICAEGNIDRVSRVLALVHAGVAALIEGNTPQRNHHLRQCCPLADDISIPDEFIILLPETLQLTHASAHMLERLIHEYMVYRVIADWLSITHESYAATWTDKATATLAEITSLLHQRHPHTRRPSPM